jgi:hypothetical protein
VNEGEGSGRTEKGDTGQKKEDEVENRETLCSTISPKAFRYSPIRSMMEIARGDQARYFPAHIEEGGVEGQP